MANAEILVCLPFFRGHDRSGITGGTISNFNLIALLSAVYKVTVLTFDKNLDEGVKALDVNLVHQPAFLQGKLDKYFRWTDFVESNVKAVVHDQGAPALFISTTTTVFCNDLFNQSKVKTIGLIRAFENFGFLCADAQPASRMEYFKRDLRTGFRSADSIKNSDLLVTNSQYMKHRIMARFDTASVEVIYPALGEAIETAEPATAKENSSGPVVGFVNRNKGKNAGLIVKLAARLPAITFLAYGTRPKGVLPENLVFCGWESDRVKMFRSAQLWLVPSTWPEPFGRVSIEAQALGCHVLVSNRGGLPETVPDNGSIVSSNDVESWAARVMNFFESDKAMMAHSEASIINKFGTQAINREWLRCIDAVLMSTE